MIALPLLLLLCVANIIQAEENVCKEPIYTGPCRAYIERWGFNATSGNCEKFIYGGCGGNKNRFNTKKECRRTCVKKTKRKIKTPSHLANG
ncbi:amyloid beta A4 protein [Echinococcus multilocularis]|uniref:Amyloid beta A4 protein n=1 Tax=Echinococcus multilocularis TaxID=6211 RepID=A0A068YN91_ECHMU|nr:amyloid beta A4 protein [Echinococcus multilocularis]